MVPNNVNSSAIPLICIVDQDASMADSTRQLFETAADIPIIFITGHSDIPMTVQARKSGAAEFLTKPFREQELLDAIHRAIDSDRASRLCSPMMANLTCRRGPGNQRRV